MVIELRTWCYLYNLVGYVLKYLNDLKSPNLIYDHPFTPAINTVVFSIMEAKDHSTNLLLCVERYKSHIKQFRNVKWERKTFRSCLFIWRL